MSTVGQCYNLTTIDNGYLIAVWDLGDAILVNNGEVVKKSDLVSCGFKLHDFKVHQSVYGKLSKLIEGVRVSEFLNVGDEVMIFIEGYTHVVLHKITAKDFECNIYMTDLSYMIPFGSLKGVYTKFTYPK